MLVLARGRFGSAPARVLQQVQRSGTVTREDLARLTGLSPATVARTVGVMVDECLLRERPDLARDGAVGRPSVPLEIDSGRHSVLGVHVGKRVTTVGLVALDGRVVGQSRFRTGGDLEELVERASRLANNLVSESLERTVLAVGLVAPWDELPYDERKLADALAGRTGLEVSTANHVAAVAAAEYLGQRRHGVRCTAYVYVRETAGMALANDMVDRTEISRVANLTHLPTRSDVACSCGQTGCFAATAGDDALAQRAADQGIVTRPEIEQVLAAARSGDVASRPAAARAGPGARQHHGGAPGHDRARQRRARGPGVHRLPTGHPRHRGGVPRGDHAASDGALLHALRHRRPGRGCGHRGAGLVLRGPVRVARTRPRHRELLTFTARRRRPTASHRPAHPRS